ncbi:D-TA family PLP-dependent enzyme [Sphingobacterium sp. SRCM116780]|uniref:D-TA family PLP-dependent enzyme n=1 Tax=Sphingobacterium sp. SRCM116780 TaxID=2907623 RepID=UPI001F1FFE35|nr:D-TA family PLP-dependent enzyme [Sphingobacterium sp. SRCM116780]UIR57374.1 D-TA family PLP-dependent enzyme [Sphingobacterium sp. SRCM116780]
MQEWFELKDVDTVDSPALLVYPDRVKHNIQQAIALLDGDCSRLRPHIKTNKTAEICQLLQDFGIRKFKCATIAEAELLGMIAAEDVLLAYQPTGPKMKRLINLIKSYPKTTYSCLVDHVQVAQDLNAICAAAQIVLAIYIDVNVGMGRTGIHPDAVEGLAMEIIALPQLHLIGVHGYDGHIHDPDLNRREEQSDASYQLLVNAFDTVRQLTATPLHSIIGGSPPFPFHARRMDVECSPGTFVFWDYAYGEAFKEQKFEYAALLLTRVISIVDEHHICLDLGYKAVGNESPLPRVQFLGNRDMELVSQSEEHLVVKVRNSSDYPIGTPFYGVPKHVCPTVALYEEMLVVEDGKVSKSWKIKARDRKINY